MFTVGPTFFSDPGDHPPGDGLTRLQCLFAGASSADVSSYAIGSGTQNGGTLYAGYFECLFDSVGTHERQIIWEHADLYLSSSSEPLTAEYFVTVEETVANPQSQNEIGRFKFGSAQINNAVAGYVGGLNNFAIADYGDWSYDHGEVWDTLTHVAVVFRTTGFYDVYIGGVRVHAAQAYSGGAGQGSVGSVIVGGTGQNYVSRITCRYYGVRVRRAEMYAGASFAPPASPAAWGPP